MRSRTLSAAWLALTIILIFTLRSSAQCGRGLDRYKGHFPSAEKLETPPDDALQLNSGVARSIVRQLLAKRYPVQIADRFLMPGVNILESSNIKVTAAETSFDYEVVIKKVRSTLNARLDYKKLGYFLYGPGENKGPFFCATDHSRNFLKGIGAAPYTSVLAWRDEKEARMFSRAFNRLIYDARNGVGRDDLTAFVTTAEQLKKAGARAPDDWDRHRVLAEQSVKERDFSSAVQHYENGVASYPLWAEGWFNAALIYGELGEYEYAASRMKRYLILMPDAPDAKPAREKVIVWEEKAKN